MICNVPGHQSLPVWRDQSWQFAGVIIKLAEKRNEIYHCDTSTCIISASAWDSVCFEHVWLNYSCEKKKKKLPLSYIVCCSWKFQLHYNKGGITSTLTWNRISVTMIHLQILDETHVESSFHDMKSNMKLKFLGFYPWLELDLKFYKLPALWEDIHSGSSCDSLFSLIIRDRFWTMTVSFERFHQKQFMLI